MKRRSSFKTFTPKDGKDAAAGTSKPNRRISFSEKKSVRLFFGEEMPKTWNKTYEESDHVDSSGGSNLITTNVGYKPNEPDLNTFNANKENIQFDNIPTRSSNSLSETNSVNNTVDFINKTQQSSTSTIYINNTPDFTLLPRDKFKKWNNPKHSFTLEEEEIFFLQNRNKQKQNHELSETDTESKQLELKSLKRTFMNEAENMNISKSLNITEGKSMDKINNKTVREVFDIEFSTSINEGDEITPVLECEKRTKPIYTPFRNKKHIAPATEVDMDISAAIENFEEKLNQMSLNSNSNQSSNFEVNFHDKPKMNISDSNVGESNRKTIYYNENIVQEANVDLELTNTNVQKTIIFEAKRNDLRITLTSTNSEADMPVQKFDKEAVIVKEPMLNKIAPKSENLITRKTFKSSSHGETSASIKTQLYQRNQHKQQKLQKIQNRDNENIKNIDNKINANTNAGGNPVDGFCCDLSLSSPILPPELMSCGKTNLWQLNNALESGKITLKCRNSIGQNTLKQVGRKLFSPLKQDSSSMEIIENELIISPINQNTDAAEATVQKYQKKKYTSLDFDLNKKPKHEENLCELSMSFETKTDQRDIDMKIVNKNQVHQQLRLNKVQHEIENTNCKVNCEDKMRISYVTSPTAPSEHSKESNNALRHMLAAKQKNDLLHNFDFMRIEDESMGLSNKGKDTQRRTVSLLQLTFEDEKDFKDANYYKQQFIQKTAETVDNSVKQRKTIHFSDRISLDEQIEPLSETQYLLGNLCENLRSPKQTQNRNTIYFKGGANLEFELIQKKMEEDKTKKAEGVSMLSETQYLLEDINDIDTEFVPINYKPNALKAQLQKQCSSSSNESNTEIEKDKNSFKLVEQNVLSDMEETLIINTQSPVKSIKVNDMEDQFKYNLSNSLIGQAMASSEDSNLDMEDPTTHNEKCQPAKVINILPNKTQILKDSIEEAQTETPPIGILGLSKNKTKRKTIIFADEAIEKISNEFNKMDDSILSTVFLKPKQLRSFPCETPHKSLIEFEHIEKECAQDISYVCPQEEKLSKMLQNNKKTTKRQTTYENAELEVSGLQPINNFEVTSAATTSPMLLKKRFPGCITPNFLKPKKRQTMFYDNLDIEADISIGNSTKPNAIKRKTIVFNKDISMNDDIHNENNISLNDDYNEIDIAVDDDVYNKHDISLNDDIQNKIDTAVNDDVHNDNSISLNDVGRKEIDIAVNHDVHENDISLNNVYNEIDIAIDDDVSNKHDISLNDDIQNKIDTAVNDDVQNMNDISLSDDIQNEIDIAITDEHVKTAIESLNANTFECKGESNKSTSASNHDIKVPMRKGSNDQDCIMLCSPSWLCISNASDMNISNESIVNYELAQETLKKNENDLMDCKALDVSGEEINKNESKSTTVDKSKSRISNLVNSEIKNNSVQLCSMTSNCEKSYTNSSLAPVEVARRTYNERKDSIYALLRNDTISLEETKMPEDNFILEENAITITDVSQYPLRRTNNNITVSDSEIVDKIHLSLVDTTLDGLTNSKENIVYKCLNTIEEDFKIIEDQTETESRNNQPLTNRRKSVCRKCRKCQETMVSDTTAFVESFDLPEFLPLPTMERLKKLRSTKRLTIDDIVEYNRRISLDDSFDIEHLSAIEFDVDEEPNYVDEADEIIKTYENNMESARQEFLKLKGERLMKDRRSFAERLDDKLNDIANDWIFNYQNLNLFQFNHKKITIFCLEVAHKETNSSSGIEIESIKVKNNSLWPKKNWLPIDYVIHFQLKLELPYDLRNWCKSNDEMIILNMLLKVNDVCQDISKMIRKLWRILFTQNATLMRDNNQIYVEKKLRKVMAYKVQKSDFRIEITNLRKLCFKDIIYPPLYTFHEEIQSLPCGLDFLQAFLANPTQFIKT